MAEPTYTVFVRVPIPRGDFVDPPHVNWNPTKDDALWKILSLASQTEIDWNKVAIKFEVPVDFLLQQVAYLTERHASQVRAQVRKATAAAKGASPTPGIDSSGALRSLRRDSAATQGDGVDANVDPWARPLIARSASTNTTVAQEPGTSSPRPTKGLQARNTEQVGRRRMSSLPIIPAVQRTSALPERGAPQRELRPTRETSPEPTITESSMTSDEDSEPAQSRIIRRPPRFSTQELSTYEEDDGEESEPAFQPYRPSRDEGQGSAGDLTSTLRGGLSRGGSKRANARAGQEADRHSQTSDSDTGSPALVQRPGGHRDRDQRTPGPLSPRRTTELANRNSGSKATEGSDGTPSMGSSYSDLDDASVTQSALEEALASHMGNRGASSRFSSIGHAFRSRYGPSGNQ